MEILKERSGRDKGHNGTRSMHKVAQLILSNSYNGQMSGEARNDHNIDNEKQATEILDDSAIIIADPAHAVRSAETPSLPFRLLSRITDKGNS